MPCHKRLVLSLLSVLLLPAATGGAAPLPAVELPRIQISAAPLYLAQTKERTEKAAAFTAAQKTACAGLISTAGLFKVEHVNKLAAELQKCTETDTVLLSLRVAAQTVGIGERAYLGQLTNCTQLKGFIEPKLPAATIAAQNNETKLKEVKSHLAEAFLPAEQAEACQRDEAQCPDFRAKCRPPSQSPGAEPFPFSAASGAGWQTALFTGLADFLVQRSGEELALWLLQSFRTQLCQGARSWIPQTCALLDQPENSDTLPGSLFAATIRIDLERFPIAAVRTAYQDPRDAVQIFYGLRDLQAKLAIGAIPGNDALVALLNRVVERPELKSACVDEKIKGGAACAIMSMAVLSLHAKDILFAGDPSDQNRCTKLLELLQNGKSDKALRSFFTGELPSGLSTLLDEVKGAACQDGRRRNIDPKDTKQRAKLDAALTLLQQGSKLVASLAAGTKRTHELLRSELILLLKMAQQGAVLAEASTKQVDTFASTLALMIGVSDTAEALLSFFQELRKGEPPLELLAGLSQLAEQSPLSPLLCKPQTDEMLRKGSQVACTMAAVGTLVARVSAVLPSLHTTQGDRWDDLIVCNKLQEIFSDPEVKKAFERLYGPDNLPTRLTTLFNNPLLTCEGSRADTDADPRDARSLRHLLRAIFDLERQLSSLKNGSAPPVRERVAELVAILSRAIASAATLVGQADSADLQRVLASMQILADVLQGQYTDGIRGVLMLALAAGDQLPAALRRYLPLIGDLASARDAGSVKATLQAAAAPVGSWRGKRARLGFSISAVVGAQSGWELPLNAPEGVALHSGGNIGPMAALGLELAGPVQCGTHSPWSMGLFLSVLDVGQLALARITDLGRGAKPADGLAQQTGAQVASNIDFLDVIAPGLFWKVGIAKTPLTFGVGGVFAPRLRKYSYVDPGGVEHSADDAFSMFRVAAFLGVDLTLFPLL